MADPGRAERRILLKEPRRKVDSIVLRRNTALMELMERTAFIGLRQKVILTELR